MVGMNIALLIIVGLGLCMPACDLDGEHGPVANHASHCAIAVPQLFQLLVSMNAFFLVIFVSLTVLPAPAFSLLKPPRYRPVQGTAR